MCRVGYHVCTRKQVPHWRGTELWEVEVRGEHLGENDKECWSEMRFVRKLKWTRKDMEECAWQDAVAADAADAANAAARWAAADAADAANAAARWAAASCAAAAERARQLAWIEARIGERLED
jgi:hypothetical protein